MEPHSEPTDAELTEADVTEAKLPETEQADSGSESGHEAVPPSASEHGVAPEPEATGNSVATAPQASEDGVAAAAEATGDGATAVPETTGDSSPPAAAATGDPRVDAAIAHLRNLADLPVSEHPPVFERIHGDLVEVLGELHTGASLAGHAEPGESAEG